MPFVTGSAGNITDVRTALINACTANGWTLSGEVLHKGGVFVRLQIVGQMLTFMGGTGVDGSNALVNSAPNIVQIGAFTLSPMLFPAAYDIHVHGDEVYLIVNYNATDYQWAAFGQSVIQGLGGTGMWLGATLRNVNAAVISPSVSQSDNGQTAILFGMRWDGGQQWSYYVHHGMDGLAWAPGVFGEAFQNGQITGHGALAPLYQRSPNADGDAVLLPLRAYLSRPGNRSSLIVDCAHARLIRIDNFEPRDVITLGPDQWRVYPWFRKSLVLRDGGSSITHSGTLGWAVRFDGTP